MQNETINRTLEILQFGLDFAKDMNASDWIRAPFLILFGIIKFLMKNFISIIIVIVALVIIYFLFKFFRWWKKEDREEIGEEDYLEEDEEEL